MSGNAKRPVAIVFDVIETLFGIEPLRAELEAGGLPGDALEVWFARVLRDAFALEVSGEYKTFREVASATLEVLAREHKIDIDKLKIEEIIKMFAELPAHPDVKPTFKMLRDASVRIAPLTNGSAETTKKMFQNAKLDKFIERYISIDEVKHWKPAREVYLHAANTLDLDPCWLALVSAHDWDIRGAKQAGLTTAFVQRKAVFSTAMGKPDLSAASLDRLADDLVRLARP